MCQRYELRVALPLLVETALDKDGGLKLGQATPYQPLEQRLAQVVDAPGPGLHPPDQLDRTAVGLELKRPKPINVEEEGAILPAEGSDQEAGPVHQAPPTLAP